MFLPFAAGDFFPSRHSLRPGHVACPIDSTTRDLRTTTRDSSTVQYVDIAVCRYRSHLPSMSFSNIIEVGVPTLDRPFGIHLWPIFNKALELVVGYPADDFKFVPFETPMSTLKSTSIFIVIYYFIIFGGREMMRSREAFKLKSLFLIHNFYLTAISGILLVLFIEQLIPELARNGIFHAICHHDGGWTQPMVVLYYVSVSLALPCMAG